MHPSSSVHFHHTKSSSYSRGCCGSFGKRMVAITLVAMLCLAALFTTTVGQVNRARPSRVNHSHRHHLNVVSVRFPTAASANRLCEATLRALQKSHAGKIPASGADLFIGQTSELFDRLTTETHKVFARLQEHPYTTREGRSNSVDTPEFWEDLRNVSTPSDDAWTAVMQPSSVISNPHHNRFFRIVNHGLKVKPSSSIILFSPPHSPTILPHFVLVKLDPRGEETVRRIEDAVRSRGSFDSRRFAKDEDVTVLSTEGILDTAHEDPPSFISFLPPHARCNIGARAEDIQTMLVASKQVWRPNELISKEDMQFLSKLRAWKLPDHLIYDLLEQVRGGDAYF